MGIFIMGVMMGMLVMAATLVFAWKPKSICEDADIKAGDRLVFELKSGNPFEWGEYEIKIIEIQHQWAKYTFPDGSIGYAPIEYLLKNYKKV